MVIDDLGDDDDGDDDDGDDANDNDDLGDGTPRGKSTTPSRQIAWPTPKSGHHDPRSRPARPDKNNVATEIRGARPGTQPSDKTKPAVHKPAITARAGKANGPPRFVKRPPSSAQLISPEGAHVE